MKNSDTILRPHSQRGPISIAFDPSFSPDEVKGILTALADYYRACGGAGLELDFDLQEAFVREPVHA